LNLVDKPADKARLVQSVHHRPILSDSEADSRLRLLAELRAELSALGVESVLARNHRLVLRYNAVPLDPSGLTDPQLHIFTAEGKRVATTDGMVYRLDRGGEFPAGDAAAAATLIRGGRDE
jgi:hypothetical protein